MVITNSAIQDSGSLVTLTGTVDQVGLAVVDGQVTMDPNSLVGGALVITNTATQTSGNLVDVTGVVGQVALSVAAGTISSGDATDSSSATTGSVIIAGGMGVVGNIYAGGTVYSANVALTSDQRFKKNVTGIPVGDSLRILERLEPVNYLWRRDEFPVRRFHNRSECGFLAQDVKEILPEIVHQDGEGYYSVEYSRLIVHLVNYAKDSQKQLSLAQEERASTKVEMRLLTTLVSELIHEIADLKENLKVQ